MREINMSERETGVRERRERGGRGEYVSERERREIEERGTERAKFMSEYFVVSVSNTGSCDNLGWSYAEHVLRGEKTSHNNVQGPDAVKGVIQKSLADISIDDGKALRLDAVIFQNEYEILRTITSISRMGWDASMCTT